MRGVTVLFEIMTTTSSNTAVYKRGFSSMNREESVLQTRLGDYSLDHLMWVNIDGPSLDNFDAEKFVSDWLKNSPLLETLKWP